MGSFGNSEVEMLRRVARRVSLLRGSETDRDGSKKARRRRRPASATARMACGFVLQFWSDGALWHDEARSGGLWRDWEYEGQAEDFGELSSSLSLRAEGSRAAQSGRREAE